MCFRKYFFNISSVLATQIDGTDTVKNKYSLHFYCDCLVCRIHCMSAKHAETGTDFPDKRRARLRLTEYILENQNWLWKE